MMASTVFFFLRISSFSEHYKPALTFTGLVTLIAMYHYFRIFNSFREAYTPCQVIDGVANYNICDADKYGYSPTGIPFNDAYRYVDWLLTVPLLLIEIILVMRLSEQETTKQCSILGTAAALMIAFGYPGETSGEASTRWIFWFISMIPFTYIVYSLFFGLKASQDAQPESCRNLVKWACYATVVSWCTYPIVYIFPMISGTDNGKEGLSAVALCGVQVGYTFSDIISKCGVGYLVYNIGHAKSQLENVRNKYGEMEDESESVVQMGTQGSVPAAI